MRLAARALVATAAIVLTLIVLTLGTAGSALAHGNPAIRVEPMVVGAGGTIAVVGTDMSPGVEFVITLERAGRSVEIGRATAEGEEDEGGFTVKLTIPLATPPGSHTLRAASVSGKTASADLTVTDGVQAASAPAGGTATMVMASADLHDLDRSKTAAELWAFGLASIALAVAGVALVRRTA